MSKKIKMLDLIENNAAILYKLNKGGINSIPTALDYMVIYATYKTFKHIDSTSDRKLETADKCGVSVRTVSNALTLLDSEI